jgi:hypothetical protein
MSFFSNFFSCFKGKKETVIKKKASLVLHNDTVFYKFLNARNYELNLSKIQVWIFNKELKCVHASNNKNIAETYIQKHVDEIAFKEDVLRNFKNIIQLGLKGIESKRTIMLDNTLLYIEGRTLCYNEDLTDIYGSMLLFMPYKIIPETRYKKRTDSSIETDIVSSRESSKDGKHSHESKRTSLDDIISRLSVSNQKFH